MFQISHRFNLEEPRKAARSLKNILEYLDPKKSKFVGSFSCIFKRLLSLRYLADSRLEHVKNASY